MKKEYSEEEIYAIDQQFQKKLKEEESEANKLFYRMLIFILGIFLAGAIVGYLIGK